MGGPSVWMIIELPTPQRTPTLNRLAREVTDLRVLYLRSGDAAYNWGVMPIAHQHSFWDAMPLSERIRALYRIMVPKRNTSIVVYGHRGVPRVAALLAGHVNRARLLVRSDTNQVQIENGSASRRWLRRRVLRLLVPRSATAWTIGIQSERFWREEVGLDRIARIPYEVEELPGWVTSSQLPNRTSDPDELILLYVGRLIAIKRVSDLIQAFALLQDSTYVGWRLRIVGDGPERSRLEQQALSDSRVSFEGFKSYDQLGAIFGQCDVLILPSEEEPWGLVVNEALGYGLYVVASDRVGSAFDLLDFGTGTTFPVGNIKALSVALRLSAKFPSRKPQACRSDTAGLMAASLRGATHAAD